MISASSPSPFVVTVKLSGDYCLVLMSKMTVRRRRFKGIASLSRILQAFEKFSNFVYIGTGEPFMVLT
jgi:hypothetical protein